MTEMRLRKCDACGLTVDETETNGEWLNVRCVVGNVEAYELLQQKRYEYGDDVALDHGDFCGLTCLANWASARANMRELNG